MPRQRHVPHLPAPGPPIFSPTPPTGRTASVASLALHSQRGKEKRERKEFQIQQFPALQVLKNKDLMENLSDEML